MCVTQKDKSGHETRKKCAFFSLLFVLWGLATQLPNNHMETYFF